MASDPRLSGVRRLIVSLLEKSCGLMRHAGACRVARWSDSLDQRWGTAVWKPCEPESHA